MTSFNLTLILAIVVILFALFLLTLSLIFTGRLNYRIGACGKDPTKMKRKDGECGTDSTCSLCSDKKDKDINEKVSKK